MSCSEDIIVTGGNREGCAVYSVWDTRSSYGETFVHPCKKDGCRVNHVSIDQREEIVELRTGCRCGTLCRWDISSDPHCLLEETRSGSLGWHTSWADDGSKAVSGMENDSTRLCILSTPHVQHSLGNKGWRDSWQFSPGPGDKVLGEARIDHDVVLAMWECADGRKLFQKSYRGNLTCRFSPDGTTVACAGGGVAELISAEDGTVLRSWDGIDWVYNVEFFPKRDNFLMRTYGGIHLFDGHIRRDIKMDSHSIRVSPNGQRVAIVGQDYIDIFNHALDERFERHKLNSPSRYRTYFSWNHSILVTVYQDSISFHHLLHNIQTPSSTVENLFLSPDSRHLLTFHVDKSIHVWDVKSSRRIYTFDNNFTGSSGPIKGEYAPNSSGILLWDPHRLMALQFSSCLIKWPLSVLHASSKLLAVTFFRNSDHLLIVNSDGNVTTVSLNYMSTRSMSSLNSRVQEIQQLAISPNEQLIAICSDVGLIIHEIGQEVYQIPPFSMHVNRVRFSPDGADLYTVEDNVDRWMLSRIDTRSWTMHRLWVEYGDYTVPYEPSFTKTTIGDSFSALRYSCKQENGHIDRFIDLSTSKQVIPPLSRIKYGDLFYQNELIMHLPDATHDEWSITQDHLAYIHRGKAFVVDYSSLIKQA
jgi:WD40 repeat protein